MIKFLHLGDTHIGRSWPSGIKEGRIRASIKSFEFAVDKAIEKEVDFLIHTGDFFAKVYPWHRAVKRVNEILDRLREADIPIYVIRGNHDGRFDYGGWRRGIATELLQRGGIVHLIDPKTDPKGKKGFRDYNENIRIYGIGYYGHKTSNKIDKYIKELDKSKLNILLLHNFLDGYTTTFPSKPSIPIDKIKDLGFDYVGVGHDHQPRPPKELGDSLFVCSGSTIKEDFKESEQEKLVYLVEIEDDEIKAEKIPVPQEIDLKRIRIDVGDLKEENMRDDIKDTVNKEIEGIEASKKIAMKVVFTGEMKEGFNARDLPFNSLKEYYNNRNKIVFCNFVRDLDLPEESKLTSPGEFHLRKFLSKNLKKSVAEKFLKLHNTTKDCLGKSEYLTSGNNLNKDGKDLIKSKIRDRWFEDANK